jgi:hypothetical protein
MTTTNADHPLPSFTPSLQLPNATRLSSLNHPTRRLAPRESTSKSNHSNSPFETSLSSTAPQHLPSIPDTSRLATRRLIQDLTVGQFVYVIRKRIKLAPEKAIFIFVDDILPPTAALMSAIYEEHQ